MLSLTLSVDFVFLQLTSMLPVYEQLLDVQPPLRMLVYSGDVDGIVPITGTRAWLAQLFTPSEIVTPWHPWLLNKQTGGWAQEYQGLTFASVRNAGHMVRPPAQHMAHLRSPLLCPVASLRCCRVGLPVALTLWCCAAGAVDGARAFVCAVQQLPGRSAHLNPTRACAAFDAPLTQ